MSRTLRSLVARSAIVCVSASALGAQVQPKQFAITTRVGGVKTDRAASLEPAALIGLDTEYALRKWFGIGTAVDVSRGYSTKKDFLTRLRYGNSGTGGGDSIYYQNIGQPVNTVNLSLFGTLRYPAKTVSPFLMAGVGTYTMILDAQVNGRATRKTDLSYTGGAGVSFRLGDRVGIQLDARAVTLSGYDRRFLNPAEGRVETITPFPEDFPTPPPAKTTAIGTMFTLGFRYVPAAIGGRN